MKKTILMIFLGSMLTLAACQKKDDGGSYAATPANCNLNGTTNCNPSIYSQQGWQNYNTNFAGTNGSLCGCNIGFAPVNNSAWGLGCAPVAYFNQPYQQQYGQQYYGQQQGYYGQGQVTYTYVGYTYPAQNNQWTNQPNVSYSSPYTASNLNCSSQAYQACNVQIPNSCGYGAVCLQTSASSLLGVCRNSGYGNTSGR